LPFLLEGVPLLRLFFETFRVSNPETRICTGVPLISGSGSPSGPSRAAAAFLSSPHSCGGHCDGEPSCYCQRRIRAPVSGAMWGQPAKPETPRVSILAI
jgi:hypothetical protein